MNDDDRNLQKYSHCLCIHVKPATVFFGSLNLTASVLLSVMALFDIPVSNSVGNERRKFSLAMTEPPMDTSLNIMVNLSIAALSALLLVGVFKSRSSYLMPFFGIQLYNFFLFLPDSFHSPFYSSNNPFGLGIHSNGIKVAESKNLNLSNNSFLFNASTEFLQILFRLYFICVVWKCYRYLKIKKLMLPLRRSNFLHDIDVMVPSDIIDPANAASPPDYYTIVKDNALPDYESAIRLEGQMTPEQVFEAKSQDVALDQISASESSSSGNTPNSSYAATINLDAETSSKKPN